jgi:hypothetical protein
MRPMRQLLTALVAVMLIVVPASIAQGAQGGGKPDNPGSGQGNSGGHSGKANNPKGNLYSDLWVIARDDRGVPITVTYEIRGEGDEPETATCVQPITFDGSAGFTPLTGSNVYPYDATAYLVPLVGTSDPELEPCDVRADAVSYVSEVDLGRLNLGRAPERVLTKQLAEVLIFLNSGELGLDSSGRFIHVGTDETLDSPLANLALYQAVLENGPTGELSAVDNEAGLGLDPLELTAAAFAAGAPKEGFEITVDTIQYLNRILNIPTQTGWGEVMPVLTGDTGEQFLNYAGFAYDRSAMFPGCVTYVDPLDGYTEKTSYLKDVVPFEGDVTSSGIDGYASLAEDARDVLVWVHDMGALVLDVDPITAEDVCLTSPPTE